MRFFLVVIVFAFSACKSVEKSSTKEVEQDYATTDNLDLSKNITYIFTAKRFDDITIVKKRMIGSKLDSHAYTVNVRIKDSETYGVYERPPTLRRIMRRRFMGPYRQSIAARGARVIGRGFGRIYTRILRQKEEIISFEIDGPATWTEGTKLKQLVICETKVAAEDVSAKNVADLESENHDGAWRPIFMASLSIRQKVYRGSNIDPECDGSNLNTDMLLNKK